MSTLWNRSGTIERYADDLPAVGAKAYFFNGGTTTPLIVFHDAAQTVDYPHPLQADSRGRWPDVFVPFGSYDVRITTEDDVQLTYTLQIPNPDNTAPPPPAIDPATLLQTGMIHCELINTSKVGFVRLNGRTIGNAASGGTERAAADTEALFTYLWQNLIDTVAPVSGGRGASAAADFAVNKNITLPDLRGAVPMGLDNMGAAPGGFFPPGLVFAVGDELTPGSFLGQNGMTLTLGQLPSHNHTGATNFAGDHFHALVVTLTTDGESVQHTHDFTWSGTTTTESAAHSHTYILSNAAGAQLAVAGGAAPIFGQVGASTGVEDTVHTHDYSGTSTTSVESIVHTHNVDINENTTTNGLHQHTLLTSTVGTGDFINQLPRAVLVTWYIKL